MATKVTMPQMGYDMTEGAIQTWLKKEGDKVEKGEIIAEIETDKATVELEAFAGGILSKILIQPGQTVPVGEAIAVIAEPGEQIDWNALGIDGGGAATTSAPAPIPFPVPAPKPAASLKTEPAEAKQTSAQWIAPDSPVTRTLPKVAGNLVNLTAPMSAAGGPGGAAVESEMVGETKPQAAAPASTAAPAPAPAPVSAPAPASTTPTVTRQEGERIKSSPLARKVAGEMGLDLSQINGSGPGGRIIKNDVVNHAGAGTAVASTPASTPAPTRMTSISTPDPMPAHAGPGKAGEGEGGESIPASQSLSGTVPAPAHSVEELRTAQFVAEATPAPSAQQPQTVPTSNSNQAGGWVSGPFEDRDVSRMRQTIARRLTEAKQQIPHIYISNEIDMGEALKLRQTINASLVEEGVKVSVNDLVVKACAKALKKFPMLNASWLETKVRLNQRINVSFAVALEDGLLTPIIFDADQKSVSQIAIEAKALIEKARAGKLQPQEFQGGTFSVSNLGMFDVTDFVAVINPPNSAILAVGAVKPTPVAANANDDDSYTEVVVAQMMKVTLSVDHRTADGAVAARFLQELKRLLQNPMTLLV